MTHKFFKTLLYRAIPAFIILFYIFIPFAANAQNKIPATYCISAEEMHLFDQINELRSDFNKTKLKISASLSYVAQTHVNDLLNNRPDTSICGLSSWSDNGNWKACCYNPYVLDEDCMWDKPKELTSYPYRGYELVTFFEDKVATDSVIRLWSSSREALDMILTRERYGQKKWICVGVGINEHYVSVWFGQRADKAGKPKICDNTEKAATVSAANDAQAKSFYYLIYGSFDNLKDAKEALKRLRKNDFPKAGILEKDNRRRVYLGKYNSLKEANFAKQSLSSTYREAWILKE